MECSPAKTLMSTAFKLDADEKGKSINITTYRGMIGSLLYLTATRPDIMFVTCLCARFQANPKESHLIAVKRIFTYLNNLMFRAWGVLNMMLKVFHFFCGLRS